MKNRQSVILNAVRSLDFSVTSSIPAVLSDKQLSPSIVKMAKDAKKKKKRIEARVEKILRYPKSEDKVYKVLADIFSSKSDHVLTRDMDIKEKIKKLALKRFMLGYPPRKSGDTSIGDAINWEWIIHCAQQHPGRIVIVTRDGDYGHEFKGKYYLNSQLLQEFRERVGNKPITYTQKLSEALQHLQVKVTQSEIKAEAIAMESWTHRPLYDYLRDFYATMAEVDVGQLADREASMERMVDIVRSLMKGRIGDD